MKKYLLLFFVVFMAHSLLLAQQDNRLRLISSSHSRLDGMTGNMVNYRPVYEHKGSTLSADSGYVYTDELKREYFDAYGNVVITQPDGTVIYAHKLNYAADPQLAILTGNVRLVDGPSVLTTNYLTYNMKSNIGTYTGGGRIVNKTDTITSEKAWYFNQTKDAYFRMNVIVRTPDVHIFTDTMRYNSDSKTTFFYGPTNMKGKKGENLYTEEGYYNTETEFAKFYKNNLYTEKSRLLRGDTLYYDGKTGNGRAINHVLFIDTADRYRQEGMFGLYNKEDESILMTDRTLVTMVMDKDSTEVDSVYLTADTLFSKMILQKDYPAMKFSLDREGGELDEDETEQDTAAAETRSGELGAVAASDSVGTGPPLTTDSLRRDSLGIDSLGIDRLKALPDSLMVPLPDSLKSSDPVRKRSGTEIPVKKPDQVQQPVRQAPATAASKPSGTDSTRRQESSIRTTMASDSILRQKASIPQGGEADSLLMQAAATMLRPLNPDSIPQDSLGSDTARTRIIKAYRNVRLFKSDLQAVADSAYYGTLDSMMRFFGSPMAWTQGSQMSGDSLYLQIKNDNIDNMLLLGNAFIVNTKQDSSKFNQIKGKKITGFFTKGNLDRAFVDGNAESIIYLENEEKTGYTDLYHNRSKRIKILLKANELTDFVPIKDAEGSVQPLHQVAQEKEMLDGFIWKPSDRPVSKTDLLNRKRNQDAPPPADTEPVKPDDKKNPDETVKPKDKKNPEDPAGV